LERRSVLHKEIKSLFEKASLGVAASAEKNMTYLKYERKMQPLKHFQSFRLILNFVRAE
jgi:hypothetical protein